MLHIETPLVPSPHMSKLADRPVYLKLENLQVPGSFKIRGIGLTCQEAQKIRIYKIGGKFGWKCWISHGLCRQSIGNAIDTFHSQKYTPNDGGFDSGARS